MQNKDSKPAWGITVHVPEMRELWDYQMHKLQEDSRKIHLPGLQFYWPELGV